MNVNVKPNSIWIATINGLFYAVHMYAFVWVVSAYKMFLQKLAERKFESGIESDEIILLHESHGDVQPDGFPMRLCYRLASIY